MGVLDNEYGVMIGAPGAFRDVAEEKIANLQTSLDTAGLQHTNDQDALKALQAKFDADEIQITTLQGLLGDARAALDAAKSLTLFRDLEFNAWSQNDNAIVGGGGKGAASQKPPDSTGWAELSITPDRPIAPATANYYDCYYTKTFGADDSKKTFRLMTDWMFPTAADAAASQCLEMEARPIVKGGLMFVIACQLDFADKQLRYWGGPDDKWKASSAPQARLTPGTPYTVILDGHRDDLTVFHDSISINGVVTKLGTQYPAFNRSWGAALKCSLQLDGNSKGDPYKVKYRNTDYLAW